MTEQWIDAATARQLVSELPKNPFGTDALCQRAYAGLVATRTRLLVKGSERAENVRVPREFWRSTAAVDFDENWTAGDFTARIDRDERWQAFGVTFGLSGLLEMLPYEQQATTARQFSVVGDPAWMEAREAKRFAYSEAGYQPKSAQEAILIRARLGLISAKAILMERRDKSYSNSRPGLTKVEREWVVPDWFWSGFIGPDSSQDWTHGIFSGEGIGLEGRCTIKLTGVHFLRASLQSLLPASATEVPDANAPAETLPKAKGGRPPQPWWDDMWCSVTSLIIHGALVPKRQADVESAMLTWAAVNGHEISQTAVKPKAKKLFEAYDKEVTNFLKGGL